MTSWINGRRGTRLDARDRGLQYGDGLFETMRVRRRVIRLLDFHLERVLDGCRRLAIPAPDPRQLERELARVAALRPEGIVKLIVTRGVGSRGYRPTGRERGTRIVSLHALPSKALRACLPAARVRMCAQRVGENPTLAGLKTLNRLDSVMARAEWTDARVWEGLMQDSGGHIVCGTMTNFFVRRGGVLITPRLDRCGIAGIMRRWVLAQCGSLGLRAVEARLRWRDLGRMDEAFLTNAVAGVVPVAVIVQGRERASFPQRSTAIDLRRRLDAL